MRHRAENGQPIDHLGRIGQMLRNLIAGDRTRNGIERAAEFGGCLGLEIPHVEMAGATPLPEQDHTEIFALRRIGLGGEPHPIGQSEAAERQGTDLEEIATRDSVAGSILFSANAKHIRASWLFGQTGLLYMTLAYPRALTAPRSSRLLILMLAHAEGNRFFERTVPEAWF